MTLVACPLCDGAELCTEVTLLLFVDGCCCREDGDVGAEVTQVTVQPGREQLEGYPFCNKCQKTAAWWFIPPRNP